MKKGILVSLIFFLIIATTLTKNSTKKIDQKIFEKRENIILLKNKYELVLLDYNYLTSPDKLMEYQKLYFDDELIQKDIENLNWIEIINNKIKISNLYNDNERKK